MVTPNYGETVRLTVAQAVVKYIAAQYSVSDGVRKRFVPAAMGIFGHGNVAGLGQALDQLSDELPFVQGRNEQALGHAATAFAKHTRRTQAIAVTASIGPGALNLVTAAGTATVNRIPLLLLPGDTYATRRQGPVLQQLENPSAPDLTVNDAFRPVARFFDRINRPEQLLYSLPKAFRVLANPVETGAVVISLPQDVQSHAFDFPKSFFEPHDWKIRRPEPSLDEVAEVAAAIKQAKSPLIIAGGGIIYSNATAELEALADATGIPVTETFGGKGAVQKKADWAAWGIGLEGSPETNKLANKADLIIHVGTRLTDFATASQSIFKNPEVKFVSINVSEFDGIKQGATTIVADAKLALAALTKAVAGYKVPAEWTQEVIEKNAVWVKARNAALDVNYTFDKSTLDPAFSEDTDATITQGQLLGVLQNHSRSGDVIIAGAGGPPGDVQKVWDATEGRFAHLEFGFSCMGYELPAAIGVRLANPNPANRITTFIGDGTWTMAPTELVTAAQERLPLTIVVSENHGYQVIRRLQMWRVGNSFGNEFRYRQDGPIVTESAEANGKAPRLEGDFLFLDIVKMAEGMGAKAFRPTTTAEFAKVLDDTRTESGPVVIVVPTIPHANLPASEVWWDVAPAEVHENSPWIQATADDYNAGLKTQRLHY
jgi:3D-(3,5/4)-trihydroxycyclohexane-1,2-dione acylhydrolase (decyclizing)